MSNRKNSASSIVFLVENEKNSSPLVHALLKEKYTVQVQTKTKEHLEHYSPQNTDLLIIDSSAFSLEELSTYPRIRAVYSGLIMLLIEKIDDMLQVLLFEQGIDDLLLKPVNHLLILARIRALLRRNGQRATPANLNFNGLEINSGLRRATYSGQEIPFTSREFDLLLYLAKNACTTLDRDQLYKAIFGIEYNGYDRAIDMYVARIRSKMASYANLSQMIKTVRGNGYLFAAEN